MLKGIRDQFIHYQCNIGCLLLIRRQVISFKQELDGCFIIIELCQILPELFKERFQGDRETSVVLCTVRKSEFARLKRIIHETDENAFVMVTETTEVIGLGFKDFSDAVQ